MSSPSRLPPALPLLGHIPAFLSGKLRFLSRCAEHGRAVRLQIGEPTLLLTDPNDIQHVLTGNPSNYGKTRRLTGARGKALSGAGMQTANGAEHLRQRRLLQPAFQPRSIEAFFSLMLGRTESLLERWRNLAEVNLAEEMESLALSIIIGAIFGPGFEDRDDRLTKAITVRRAYLEYYYGALSPFPEYLPLPIVFRYRAALKEIDGAIARALDAPPAPGGSFHSMFDALRYPDGAPMNRTQMRDELLTLMSTGYETIGDALTWTLFLLASHPEAEAAVLAEIETVLGVNPPSLETIGSLRYTRMVLEESLRLYPPTWIFIRMALGNDRLPSGEAVASGDKIYLCQYVMHRHPEYFPDPERFDPERFTDAARRSRPRFAYFPFGAGQRVCIGEQFALQEAAVVLAQILPRFRIEIVPGQKIVPRAGITLRPKHGLRIRLTRR